ncbi:hypothetical protein M2428_002693 [Arthrobacter sp. ES3-54]|jgi:hypothetical protein|nr:hypothetical protein [Arthrobacter sp. ES3-54]
MPALSVIPDSGRFDVPAGLPRRTPLASPTNASPARFAGAAHRRRTPAASPAQAPANPAGYLLMPSDSSMGRNFAHVSASSVSGTEPSTTPQPA